MKKFSIRITQGSFKTEFVVRENDAGKAYGLAKNFYEDNSPVFKTVGGRLPYRVYVDERLVRQTNDMAIQFVDAASKKTAPTLRP